MSFQRIVSYKMDLEKGEQLPFSTSSSSKHFLNQNFQVWDKRRVKARKKKTKTQTLLIFLMNNEGKFRAFSVQIIFFLSSHFQKEAKANINMSIQLSTCRQTQCYWRPLKVPWMRPAGMAQDLQNNYPCSAVLAGAWLCHYLCIYDMATELMPNYHACTENSKDKTLPNITKSLKKPYRRF